MLWRPLSRPPPRGPPLHADRRPHCPSRRRGVPTGRWPGLRSDEDVRAMGVQTVAGVPVARCVSATTAPGLCPFVRSQAGTGSTVTTPRPAPARTRDAGCVELAEQPRPLVPMRTSGFPYVTGGPESRRHMRQAAGERRRRHAGSLTGGGVYGWGRAKREEARRGTTRRGARRAADVVRDAPSRVRGTRPEPGKTSTSAVPLPA